MRLLLAALLSTSALLAQEPAPARALPADTTFNKLRGVNFFFIDVKLNDTRIEDGDLRTELKDVIELELRRTNIAPKESPVPSETSVPMLTIEVKFDRGLGRAAADIELTVRDTATIVRNNEKVLAVTYSSVKRALPASDANLTREVKGRTKELVTELIEGMRKANGR